MGKQDKPQSRWNSGATRFSSTKTVERHRWVKGRHKIDAPTERAYADGFRETHGWRNGARIRITNGDTHG
jgi:hypothetical protein